MVKSKYVIGIDPGARKYQKSRKRGAPNNGFAVWGVKKKELLEVSALWPFQIQSRILEYKEMGEVFVRIEDPEQAPLRRSEKTKFSAAKQMGVVNMYEAFFICNNIPYERVRPIALYTKGVAIGLKFYADMTKRTDHPTKDAQIAACMAYNANFPNKLIIQEILK